MRVSRQQLAFAWGVLFPGNYFTVLQSNVGAGSVPWRVAVPARWQHIVPIGSAGAGWPWCPAARLGTARRHCPCLGEGLVAGTRPWGQNWWPKADRYGRVLLMAWPQPGR